MKWSIVPTLVLFYCRALLLSVALLLLAVLLAPLLSNALPLYAAPLGSASDYISNDTPGATNVLHNIGFVLSDTGHHIQPTDYIIITFTNYSDITLPTSSSGWIAGSPVYSISGNRVLITNIEIPLGKGAGISGITATNPPTGQSTAISIEIANDSLGTIVYDSAVVTPAIYRETTTTSVVVSPFTASLQFRGFTSPNAFVTILLDGNVAGTTIANSVGVFDKIIPGLNPGINYTVGIYAQDKNQLYSQTVSFSAVTFSYMTIVMSDIVIPTTIGTAPIWIYQGEFVRIFGNSHPYSQISLFVQGPKSVDLILQSDKSGSWENRLDSVLNSLPIGQYEVFAKEVVSGGYTSQFTNIRNFEVRACRIADLNCDTRVDLTDFSILMYFWQQRNPSNIKADINRDGIVDLTDFSLMLYYWTE